jgi:hypothetical protein
MTPEIVTNAIVDLVRVCADGATFVANGVGSILQAKT